MHWPRIFQEALDNMAHHAAYNNLNKLITELIMKTPIEEIQRADGDFSVRNAAGL